MANINPAELQRAIAAIANCSHRLIAVRPSASARNAPACRLTDRSVGSLAHALSEASRLHPHAARWEIIAADEEDEEVRDGLRDPVVVAMLHTDEVAYSEKPVYS